MKANPLMGVSGWEAFTHGVFAIAATLLVLDIRVPDAPRDDRQWRGARQRARRGVSALPRVRLRLPFRGHVLDRHAQDHGLDAWRRPLGSGALVLYLMVISAVPFVTALLAEYVGLDNGRDRVGLVVFASWQLILAILAIATFRYAAHGGSLLKPTIDEEVLATYFRFAMFGPVTWIIAILTAIFVGGAATLILTAVVLVIFLVVEPPARVSEHSVESTS